MKKTVKDEMEREVKGYKRGAEKTKKEVKREKHRGAKQRKSRGRPRVT